MEKKQIAYTYHRGINSFIVATQASAMPDSYGASQAFQCVVEVGSRRWRELLKSQDDTSVIPLCYLLSPHSPV
jgi:hypothetical protein